MEAGSSQQRSSSASHTEQLGESTRIFIQHVKQYFSSLPVITVSVMAGSLAVTAVDLIGNLFPLHRSHILSEWLYLNAAKIWYGWQGHRLVLYPFATPAFSLWLTNIILLLPYLSNMERKHGSLRIAYLLLALFTCVIGLLYVVSAALYVAFWKSDGERTLETFGCAGLSGWTVALAFWSAFEEDLEGSSPDRMLFGVFRVPGRLIPYLILAFYFFLVPDTSLVLHLLAMAAAYAYVHKRPERLIPSDDTYRRYEESSWIQRLRNATRGFVSVDEASHAYLPIVSSGYATSFPGEGRRLGDA